VFQIQTIAKHPLSDSAPEISPELFESMWALFAMIANYWGIMNDAGLHRTQLLNFMINRIKLDPLYLGYYISTANVLKDLIEKLGAGAYQELFTNAAAGTETPPQTPMGIARQRVSNEFVSLHLALGAFKAFGAVNYPGFVGGPNIPGVAPPYRTGEVL
jgi:hypothetical protein